MFISSAFFLLFFHFLFYLSYKDIKTIIFKGKFMNKVQHYFSSFCEIYLPLFWVLRTILALRSVANHFLGVFQRGTLSIKTSQFLFVKLTWVPLRLLFLFVKLTRMPLRLLLTLARSFFSLPRVRRAQKAIERKMNKEGLMVVDFGKRMDLAIVNTYFKNTG